MRKMRIGLFLLVAAALGFGGASIVSAHLDDEPADDAQSAPDPGSVAYKHAVADPGHGRAWTLRTHTRGGRLCFHVGRLDEEGAFGHETSAGFVRKSSWEGGGGPCGPNKRRNAFFLTYDTEAGDGGRTSVYGTTAPDTSAVVVTVAGQTTTLTPNPDGTFLGVFEGIHSGQDTDFKFE